VTFKNGWMLDGKKSQQGMYKKKSSTPTGGVEKGVGASCRVLRSIAGVVVK
jgi:hypothetical protein